LPVNTGKNKNIFDNELLKKFAKNLISAIFTAVMVVLTAVTVNAQVVQNEKAVIDYTATPNTGTVSIKLTEANVYSRAIVIIKKGAVFYNYNLKIDGIAENFPLQMGDGEYTVQVLIVPPVTGKAALAINSKYKYEAKNANDVFLNPSQFVNYNKDSKTVAKAEELVKNAKTDLEKVEAIYMYVVDNLAYDTAKAAKIVSGEIIRYIPVLDDIISTGRGICFDYAAVFAAMLRSQGIPAKLVMGYVTAPNNPGQQVYHAWNEFYLEDYKGWFKINEMRFAGNKFERLDPTLDSASRGSKAAMQYIGNSSNYAAVKEY
jgi:transglutaminase-like putative cysteine protease